MAPPGVYVPIRLQSLYYEYDYEVQDAWVEGAIPAGLRGTYFRCEPQAPAERGRARGGGCCWGAASGPGKSGQHAALRAAAERALQPSAAGAEPPTSPPPPPPPPPPAASSNGPGMTVDNPRCRRHFFDNDGMVAALAFDGEGGAHFRNKYVRTKGFLAEQARSWGGPCRRAGSGLAGGGWLGGGGGRRAVAGFLPRARACPLALPRPPSRRD